MKALMDLAYTKLYQFVKGINKVDNPKTTKHILGNKFTEFVTKNQRYIPNFILKLKSLSFIPLLNFFREWKFTYYIPLFRFIFISLSSFALFYISLVILNISIPLWATIGISLFIGDISKNFSKFGEADNNKKIINFSKKAFFGFAFKFITLGALFYFITYIATSTFGISIPLWLVALISYPIATFWNNSLPLSNKNYPNFFNHLRDITLLGVNCIALGFALKTLFFTFGLQISIFYIFSLSLAFVTIHKILIHTVLSSEKPKKSNNFSKVKENVKNFESKEKNSNVSTAYYHTYIVHTTDKHWRENSKNELKSLNNKPKPYLKFLLSQAQPELMVFRIAVFSIILPVVFPVIGSWSIALRMATYIGSSLVTFGLDYIEIAPINNLIYIFSKFIFEDINKCRHTEHYISEYIFILENGQGKEPVNIPVKASKGPEVKESQSSWRYLTSFISQKAIRQDLS